MKALSKGFTIIEMLIVTVFVTIVIVFFLAVISAATGNSNGSISVGWNGVVETRCMNGLEFVIGHNGSVRQVYDQFGHGVPCK